MKLSMHALVINTFVPMLHNLSKLLDKGKQHAAARKYDSSLLVTARLAPDMFSLGKQIHIACDQAVHGTARMIGEKPPSFEHVGKTLEDLQGRLASTVEYLQGIDERSFEGAEDRAIILLLSDGRRIELCGVQLLRDWSLPHFYFHAVTTYDILRQAGVELGKRDFMSHLVPLMR